jgi:hypothetical protein
LFQVSGFKFQVSGLHFCLSELARKLLTLGKR